MEGVLTDLWIHSFLYLFLRALLCPVIVLASLLHPLKVWSQGRKPDPKCIVITGASSGLGERLAMDYAKTGVVLGIHGRNKHRLENVVQACESKGATVVYKTGDVMDADSMSQWLKEVDIKRPIDLIIANAGVSENTAGNLNSFKEATRILFRTNVDGVFNTVSPVIPWMKARKRGQICIMSSAASYFSPVSGHSVYSATKNAIKIWGEGLRAELASYNIGVSVASPAFVESPMTDVVDVYMPFKMKTKDATDRMRDGISYNLSHINLPPVMTAGGEVLQSIPATVRHFLAELGLLRLINISYTHRYGTK